MIKKTPTCLLRGEQYCNCFGMIRKNRQELYLISARLLAVTPVSGFPLAVFVFRVRTERPSSLIHGFGSESKKQSCYFPSCGVSDKVSYLHQRAVMIFLKVWLHCSYQRQMKRFTLLWPFYGQNVLHAENALPHSFRSNFLCICAL